jgi:hypothetical protein
MATTEARPLADHLSRTAVAGALVSIVITLTLAALATSRAAGHVLSPAALAVVVAGATFAGTIVGWPNAMYRGALDYLSGQVALTCGDDCPAERIHDTWTGGALWRTALKWAALGAVWAAAAGALAAVLLDDKRARFIVVFVVLAGLAGTVGVVVDTVGRHRGAHAARRATASTEPASIRRRAWRAIAAPLAVAQFIVNAGMAWVLFHDYEIHAAVPGPHALTESVALSDVTVVVVIVSAIFASLASTWGGADAQLGVVSLDDAEAQRATPKSLVGGQAVVYVALAGLLLAKLIGLVLPTSPTLLEVALARGVFAGILAFAAAGFGYVRGAVNGLAVAA